MLSVADGERDDLVAKTWQLKWLNVSEVYVPNDKRTLAWSLGKKKTNCWGQTSPFTYCVKSIKLFTVFQFPLEF